jgi:hypothetical protein
VRFNAILLAALAVLAQPAAAFAQAPTGAPRELSTDRPDQTESPYTVDTGRLQFEVDLLNATFDRVGDDRLRYSEGSALAVNAKVGLRSNIDLQFVLNPYARVRLENDTRAGVASGIGDVETRLKVNLWGNDGGRTAFGVMPYMKWPLPASAIRNGKTEGGLIIPFAIDLGRGWGLGAMTEIDFLFDDGERTEGFVNSVTASRGVTERAAMYIEIVSSVVVRRQTAWQLDLGATYAVGSDMQFDAGCNFGLNEAAPDFNPFAGFSVRF